MESREFLETKKVILTSPIIGKTSTIKLGRESEYKNQIVETEEGLAATEGRLWIERKAWLGS